MSELFTAVDLAGPTSDVMTIIGVTFLLGVAVLGLNFVRKVILGWGGSDD